MPFPSKETQKLILEYVKTVAIVCGIAFALLELYSASAQERLQRSDHTSDILAKFADIEVIGSATALLDAAQNPPQNKSELLSLLSKLTPLHETLIIWSACAQAELCDRGKSQELLCQRLIAYERNMESLAPTFSPSFTYDKEKRAKEYLGMLQVCEDMLPA